MKNKYERLCPNCNKNAWHHKVDRQGFVQYVRCHFCGYNDTLHKKDRLKPHRERMRAEFKAFMTAHKDYVFSMKYLMHRFSLSPGNIGITLNAMGAYKIWREGYPAIAMYVLPSLRLRVNRKVRVEHVEEELE